MNIALRFPEVGSEIRITASKENYLEEINYQLMSSFGTGSDSFILLNAEGFSLKEKNGQLKCSEYIYGFLKESITKEKHSAEIVFSVKNSPVEAALEGEARGPLILEKALHQIYKKALSASDFLDSYSQFSSKIDKEMSIVTSASKVLESYHTQHIQDQIESFNILKKKNTLNYEASQQELSVFELAISKLTKCEIHPKLKIGNHETLADLIDVVQLSKWKETYVTEIGRLQLKFHEIEKVIKRLPSDFHLPQSAPNLLKYSKVTEAIQTAVQFPIKLYLEYRDLCERFLNNGDAQAGARLHEEKWEENLSEANKNLFFVESSMSVYKLAIEEIKTQRKNANSDLFSLLKTITKFAAVIRNTVKSQLSMLSSLLSRSEKKLAFIRVPRLFPEAHNSTILEVSRRNHFVKAASQLQEQLNLLIEIEISERMDFLEKYRHVLPNNFVPQLSAPPFIKIVSSPDEPDLNLPLIFEQLPSTFQHIDKYLMRTESSKINGELMQKVETLEKDKVAITDTLAKSEIKVRDLQGLTEKLEKELIELKKFQDLYFQDKIRFSAKEGELNNTIQVLKAEIQEMKISNKSSLKEANFKQECEILKENYKKVANDLKNKDELIMQTALELEKLYEEFRVKEKKLSDLQARYDIEKALNLELQKKKQEVSVELANMCKELSIAPNVPDLKNYVIDLKESNLAKISFTSFTEGALALFFPTSEGQFLAFNYNCPDHYLNLESLNAKTLENISDQPYIVGQILEKKACIAEKFNPLCIPQGKEFYLLSIREQVID